MSAVLGLFHADGRPVDRGDLERMAESMAHRGPDGAGVWTEGSIGLGHLMLRTTPQSSWERLPLRNTSADLVLTADARIDNREELIRVLGLANGSLGDIADGELILAGYERWGERLPERLVGDFAFAIWDGRKRTLFCARDPLGVKPLYYHSSSRGFVLASEIKAILRIPHVPRALNETRVGDYLLGMFQDRASTFYRDIYRLPPAHSMTISREQLRVRAYWSLDAARELRLRSREEYAEAFREVFTEAVRCRVRAGCRTGALLSGGLDSSSIVCVARRHSAERGNGGLHTFSAIFPSLPAADLRRIDERPFMQAVVAGGGVSPHYVEADRLSPLGDIDRVLWHEEEAEVGPNLYMHWALYGAAARQGVRVLLDGIDGDTTVSHGLERFAHLARTGRWKTLVGEAAALSKRSGPSFTPGRIAWQYGVRPLVPDGVVRAWRRLRGADRSELSGPLPARGDFARRMGLTERARLLLRDRTGPVRHPREAHWRALTSGLLPTALEMGDKAAAAFQLEPRYPFFDRRLVELCLAFPPEQKLEGGWTRVVLRRGMAGILPEEVRWRTRKANLAPNFTRTLRSRDCHVVDVEIAAMRETIGDYVDTSALRQVYERYMSGPVSDGEAFTVFRAVTLALWLRQSGLTGRSAEQREVTSALVGTPLATCGHGVDGSTLGTEVETPQRSMTRRNS